MGGYAWLGGVAEWLKATDCKSVLLTSTKVRILPPPPVWGGAFLAPSLGCANLGACAGVAQLVELQFSKLNVASSSLVARSKLLKV